MKEFLGSDPNPQALWTRFLSEPPSRIGVDTETVSLEDRRLLGIGVAISGADAFYITPEESEFARVIAILADPSIRKIYHNAPFDLRVMRKFNVDVVEVEDTAIMARLARISAVLEDASFWTGRQTESAKGFLYRHSVNTMDKAPQTEVAAKCMVDAQATYLLYDYLTPKIDMAYYEVERQMMPIMEHISKVGIKLDQERRDLLDRLYRREHDFFKSVFDNMGFNPNSPLQVGYVMSARGNFLPMTRSRRQLATDEATLRKTRDPLGQMIIFERKVNKILSTYLVPWRGAERAYTSMNLDAITGRLSSGNAGKGEPDRNLQNIPKKVEQDMKFAPPIRSIFMPDDDVFTRMDFSQIELRILAYLAEDRKMLSVFAEGGDIHSATQEALGTSRELAKSFNFGVAYGADVPTLADSIGTSNLEMVARLRTRWMETYAGVARWIVVQHYEGLRDGYVKTMLGRPMNIPVDQGDKHAKNCAVNYPIQGTAADIFKRALLMCDQLMPSLRLQVYDEMLYNGRVQLPEGLDHITEIYTPYDVEYPERWG